MVKGNEEEASPEDEAAFKELMEVEKDLTESHRVVESELSISGSVNDSS